jgi:hypothetical protein
MHPEELQAVEVGEDLWLKISDSSRAVVEKTHGLGQSARGGSLVVHGCGREVKWSI